MNVSPIKLSLTLSAALMLPATSLYALSPDHYAQHSALASGKWVKIKAGGAGMNLVTDAQLKNMGFDNPQNVHVYGQGGRQLDFGLSASNPDDLPLLPSVRTSKGLVFFATDQVTWTAKNSSSLTPFGHQMHEYSDDTYYFLSDVEVSGWQMPSAQTSAEVADDSHTQFTERLLHESELATAGESGSQVWGEDFRSKKSQNFSFAMPGMAGDEAIVSVRFGTKTVGGSSSILLSANGNRLAATSSDKISDSTASAIGRTTQTTKTVTGLGNKLDLTIDFSYSGVLYKARLDFIEVFYPRHLALSNGELYFYLTLRKGEGVTVSGCSQSTQIWDVTDPACPAAVEYTLQGDKASFVTTAAGAREYVAFNPENVSRGVTPGEAVANQDLHGLETPDMVIITYPEYRTGSEKIASVHETYDGMKVHVINAEQIYNEFGGGKKDAMAFRRMLKMWHDRGAAEDGEHKLRYALIMGKPMYDNKLVNSDSKTLGFNPMPIWESYDGMEESESYCFDSWIGMLDDVEAENFVMRTSDIQVAVGRIPCTSSEEAIVAANKIESYVTEPRYGAWRNKVQIIADDEDNGEHLRQAENVYSAIRESGGGHGANRIYDRIYLDSYQRVMTAVGVTYPKATAQMLNNYDNGVLLTNYIGHASAQGWGHEHLWEWKDISTMTNKKLTFIYGSTCSFIDLDKNDVSGGESLLLNPDGGIIGLIAATRSVYISMNGELNRKTMSSLFDFSADGGLQRWGDVFVQGQNKTTDTNSLRYVFVGDPAVRIPGAQHAVQITSIGGKAPDDHNMPELKAMSSVEIEGQITGMDGSPITDFNGTVQLELFDGERVVTTNGYGNGTESSYNDRDKILSMSTAKVKDGKWNATLRIPPEIQGLYTQALISCYAWSDEGKEACGNFDKLYVYGFNEDSTDTEGPVIESFYVNNPNMGNNAVVCPNMVVFAKMRDESGINLSQSGIGHALTLCLDGKDYIDGLSAHFELDPEDPDSGSLVFPLNDVTPGNHTLTLTVWDNANNVSKAELNLKVGAATEPSIFDIQAINNSATASIDFKISIDRPNSQMACTVAVYDLNGRRLWDSTSSITSDMDSVIATSWDMCDNSGKQVPRGIYIYRATVESAEGNYSSKSKKLAVTSQQAAQ